MPPITEAKLFEAFGLDPSKAQGAQAQEPAAPGTEAAVTEPAQGERVQEPAGPAAEDVQTGTDAGTEATAAQAEPEEPDESSDIGTEPETRTQTPEQRRANAARRRQQEQQAAVDQAVQEAMQAERERQQRDMQDFFAKAGLKNTITGEPITSMEQFNAWNQQFSDAKLQQDLKAGKLTPEALATAIGNHPIMQQARQLMEQNQARQQTEAENARIHTDLEAIGKLNPQVKELKDILAMDTAPQFREYVGKGYSFLDAYKLANMEAMAEAKAERARNQAMQSSRGKDHLNATGNARGGGAASVPPEQMRLFRSLNPGKTDAEIQAFYNNYKSSQGG